MCLKALCSAQVSQRVLGEGIQPPGGNVSFDLAVPGKCFEFDKPLPE